MGQKIPVDQVGMRREPAMWKTDVVSAASVITLAAPSNTSDRLLAEQNPMIGGARDRMLMKP
jgi:hypothetical protein